MRKVSKRGAYGMVAIGLAGAVGLTLTAAQTAQPTDPPAPERMSYTVRLMDYKLVPPTVGIGTASSGHGVLRDEFGREAGHSYGECKVIAGSLPLFTMVCDVSQRLTGGELRLSFTTETNPLAPSAVDVEAAVLGGTGRYQDVTGRAHLRLLDGPSRTYQWDYELSDVAPQPSGTIAP
jgi:hypothetical protein